MANVTLLFALGFAFLIATFAIQNSMVVNVNLMMRHLETSLVLVILGAASLGFLLALSLQLYSNMKLRYQLYKAKSLVKQLEDELALLQTKNAPKDTSASVKSNSKCQGDGVTDNYSILK